MTTAASANTAVVWLLTDGKPGHRNQLRGLASRLQVLLGASLYWLPAPEIAVSYWQALRAQAPDIDAPSPHLILAAGSGTHRLLLALRRQPGCRTVVLMKPAFPRRWVDAMILPQHDRVPASKRVFTTLGALNAITPLGQLTGKPEALLLIGGPSKHFEWHSDTILDQVRTLIQRYPDWRWTLANSRRTPAPLSHALNALEDVHITWVDHQQTDADWVPRQLARSRAVWVTPDSNSMVFEALTAGVPTGLFSLPAKPGSRLAAGLGALVTDGYVTLWDQQATLMSSSPRRPPPLWEADRAARWLIQEVLGSQL